MSLTLRETDYQPIDGYPFQRWGARQGPPFDDIRPLTPAAAERAGRRALQIGSVATDDEEGDDALASDLYERQARLDLAGLIEWDEAYVRDWLLRHLPDRSQDVLVSYGPPWAVRVPWGAFCDHWLTFCWPDACCAWPAAGDDEAWLLRHDRDRFLIGWRRAPVAPR
jgi:hypothetical protein